MCDHPLLVARYNTLIQVIEELHCVARGREVMYRCCVVPDRLSSHVRVRVQSLSSTTLVSSPYLLQMQDSIPAHKI